MMEWNAKSPLQWDWENLFMFNSKATEYPKKSRSSDWAIDGEGSIDFGSFYASGGGRVGSGSGSDMGHTSSKSSKSASSIGEMRTSNFIHEAFDGIPEDFSNKKDFTKPHMTDTSPTFEASVEPLLGLELGRQTYFEDVCVGSNSKTSSLSVIPETPTKKSKTNCLNTHTQRCQVEGCNLDLSSAKDYHRKHRVCESHSKCSKVIVNGQERRFCQQCSRFHGLSEFDEKKRSCRRRLSDHNARRRKPQPEAVRLNSGMLSSSLNDMRQQMNMVLNRAPVVQAREATTLSWENACLPTFTQTKGYQFKPEKAGVMDGQMINFASNELSVTMGCHDPNRLLPGKATTAEVMKGFEESGMSSSNMEATQDLHRALSLLSTDSWSPSEPKATSLPTMHTRSLECWYAMQESTKSGMRELTSSSDGTNHFQEFQLLKAPYEGGFYPQ